jgi:hypothetical protein
MAEAGEGAEGGAPTTGVAAGVATKPLRAAPVVVGTKGTFQVRQSSIQES